MMALRWWIFIIGLVAMRAPAADGPFPPVGFPGGHYAALWTKSPFAIATPDAAPESADYSLVGMAQFDGVSYASLIDKQSGEHFVLASNKPVRNLTLVSISHRPDGAQATVLHNGDTLALRLENAAPSSPGGPPPGAVSAFPNAPAANPVPITSGFPTRPPVHFHHPTIVVPPRPQ